MDGLIAVRVIGHEAHYEARCACGWSGGEAPSVEWTELSLLGQFDKAHAEAIA